jgi:hypothetical protein
MTRQTGTSGAHGLFSAPWTTRRTTGTRPAGNRRCRARPNCLPPSPGAKPSLPPGRSCPVTKCCANWTRASPAWRPGVRAGRLAGPLPVVDRADARAPAARPGAVCVLRGTRSAGGGTSPAERAHCRPGANHRFAGGWPARATAIQAACPTGQGMAQFRALLDWLPDPTRYRHRRCLFRDGEHPRPRVAWLGRPIHRWIRQLGDLPNMIHPPLLNSSKILDLFPISIYSCRNGNPIPAASSHRSCH